MASPVRRRREQRSWLQWVAILGGTALVGAVGLILMRGAFRVGEDMIASVEDTRPLGRKLRPDEVRARTAEHVEAPVVDSNSPSTPASTTAASADASGAPTELFRLRETIRMVSNDCVCGMLAAGVGDRDGDGVEDFLLIQHEPVRIEVRSGATLVVLRPIIVDTDRRTISGATLGRDLDGDGWGELYAWLYSSESAPEELVRLSLADGRILWRRSGVRKWAAGYDWSAAVPRVRTPAGESLLIGAASVRLEQDLRDARDDAPGGFVAVDCASGELRFDRRGEKDLHPSLGFSLAALSDLDGDGYEEFAVSAPLEGAPAGRGVIRIGSGKDGSTLRTIENAESKERGKCTAFGEQLASVGDVDGDGAVDFSVSARRRRETHSAGTTSQWNAAFLEIHSARDGSVILTLPLPDHHWSDLGFGQDVQRVPDLDGDGKQDWIVDHPGAGNDHGAAGAVLAYSAQGVFLGEIQGDRDVCSLGYVFALLRGRAGKEALTLVTACRDEWRIYSIGARVPAPAASK